MSSEGSLRGLQDLHRDLVNLAESRLPNIERLLHELEARVEDFRLLLDKKPKNDKSRQQLSSGSVTIENNEYTVNDEFKQETIQLADALDLDELDAAKLYIQAQEDANVLDRSSLASSVILFHQRREYLLDCLRLTLRAAEDPEVDEDAVRPFRECVSLILQTQDGRLQSGSLYWKKCFSGMGDIEVMLQQVADRVQGMTITGQLQSPEFIEIMDLQRTSLTKQHETLGAILYYLVKANHTAVDDFRTLLARLRTIERYDALLIHYLPAIASSINQYAASENSCSLQEAKSINEIIISAKETEGWAMRNLQAAVKTLWIPEYSGRFIDSRGTLQSAEDEKEADARSNAFMEALRDGGFQFLLCMCRDIKNEMWLDPLRTGLTDFLTNDTPALQADPFTTSAFLHNMLMKQLQSFGEAFITNMPDTLRRLKFEEDEQRRRMQGLMQLRPDEFELHLERFLLLLAYAYEGCPEAAEAFWTDPDGNLFGFLQWAAQRQSTPRVAAFCMMLRALSEDEACANSAHKFLLGDPSTTPVKMRRTSPLGWYHVLSELEFYSSTIRDRPALQQSKSQGEIVEPESAMMLECYLRLLTHLCKESPMARAWFLTHNTFRVHEHLLLLCGSSIASRLRACAFSALTALLTDKERELSDNMWSALDGWISGGALSTLLGPRAPSTQVSPSMNEQVIFESISSGFEEPDAFLGLLQALVVPAADEFPLLDGLPFPEGLGSAYRMPGIDPYVDFVLGRVFAAKSLDNVDTIQLRILRFDCLRFAVTCLSSFNETLVAFAHQTGPSIDTAIQTSSVATYARIHPFARVMEWFFNDRVIYALFDTVRQDLREVTEADTNSPLVLSLIHSIRAIELVMTLQSTYFDIVRPIVKLQSATRKATVADSSLASFEDAILNNVDVVTNLGLYCGAAHQDLAIVSLRLLQQFSSSKKLTAAPPAGRRLTDKSRLISALERNNEAESISRSLIAETTLDVAEIEQGPLAPGIVIKQNILAFLNTCLETVADRPTIAHLLLGFACQPHGIDIAPSGLFPSNTSLCHAIVRLVVDCPFGDVGSISSWLTTIKFGGIQLLQKLWRAPMSAYLVIPELRLGDFLFAVWIQQPTIDLESLWDGRAFHEGDFLLSTPSTACSDFFRQRAALLDYVSTEFRAVSESSMATLKERIQRMLLGNAKLLDGREMRCATIFDFTDFLRFEMTEEIALPESRFYGLNDFESCRDDNKPAGSYNMSLVEQLLLFKENQLRKSNRLESPADEQQLHADMHNLVQCMVANNNRLTLQAAHLTTLRAWCQLVVVFLENCQMDVAHKQSFVLQALSVVLSRLERSYNESMETALLLAQLGRSLLKHTDLAVAQSGELDAIDVADDRYTQLFRTALIGIQHPDAVVALREVCCSICHDYLRRMSSSTKFGSRKSHALQSVKAVGGRLIEVLCDDAYAGDGESRVAALYLLSAIIGVSNQESTKEILDALAGFNFIKVVVENIRDIPVEVQETQDSAQLLSFYTAGLTLLLRISQSRYGAAQVMNAGLFNAIRQSGLFAADPDIGLDIDNPAALKVYFKLLLDITHIVNAIVLSRGQQNHQTLREARHFVQEYRSSIMSIFKRNARIGQSLGNGTAEDSNKQLLEQLVDQFTVLIAASGFLESEAPQATREVHQQVFT